MGQLEKYGLYVLCLVIFLILGVTIWGGGDAPPSRSSAMAVNGPKPATVTTGTNAPGNAPSSLIDDLFPVDPVAGDRGGNRGTATDASTKVEGGPTATDPARAPVQDPAKNGGDAKPVADPPAPRTLAYKVQDGDTYESIARMQLGKPSLWTEIQRLNPAIKPEKLRPGQDIQLPTAAALAAAAAPRNAGRGALDKPLPVPADANRTYTVKKGDNFERIAKAELGNARRFLELIEMNPDVKPERIKPGQQIKLPKK